MTPSSTLALMQAEAHAFSASVLAGAPVELPVIKHPNRYAKYRANPNQYAKDILGADLTSDQAQMFESIRVNRRTLVKASHAIGKTYLAALAASWWYDCWDEHICYITAPSWPQALGLTFKELKTIRREKGLPGIILDSGIIKDPNKAYEGSHYIRALNAEHGEGFQGEHAAPILIILEEGVGVPKYIWEATGGLMTHPDSRVFVIGNPTDEASEFGSAAESVLYNTMSISALNHPNIAAELLCEEPPSPKAVRLTWLKEMLTKECERIQVMSEDAFEFVSVTQIENALSGVPANVNDKWIYMPTAYFQGRVLGEFPTQADQQVIPKGWLKFQVRQFYKEFDVPEIGCDVARFGDDRTTLFARIGPCCFLGKELRKMDNLEIVSAIKDMALDILKLWKGEVWWGENPEAHLRLAEAKKFAIKIDVTGGLGTGPFDILKADGYNVEGVNSSEKARNQEQYKNRRSELWFDTRDRAREKRLDLSRLPQELRERLERELASPKYKSPGQKIVEDKGQMKSRLGFSPDLADGLNLAYAPSVKREWKMY